ncbi:B3 domain-containing transcription factor VRN1-like [Olea europaea subsp. europaea]|uniref:B3 domain-containing transcription factor VRN1-like n=1 Tax=Olea europaea subsp. europaea TaxID=158383 RepID=A0A8S0QX93_OLEEU|nr:B3 domain-containing transcription factor VRN1-like [Olea europaea subsp. europaea]
MGERSNLPARFFKVILPSTTTQQRLRIPNKFVEKYGNELSSIVKLSDPIDIIWCVRLVKVETTLWLHDGWEKFVEDHSIGYGYFLLFKYKGNSCFNVRIFDLTATEVDYLDNNHNFKGTNHDTRNISYKRDISSSRNEGGFNATRGRTHGVKRGYSDATETSKSLRFYRTRSKCKIEDGRLEIKKENLNIPRSFSPKNPSFTVVLKPYHLLKYTLYVPAAFAEHLASKSGYIELCDSNGKKWLVRFTRNIKPNENNLSSGWATVLKEKSLKVGDTCVFELIDINKLMLKVFTFCNTSTARIKQSSS